MDGVWGTIAADYSDAPWNDSNAQVACIQLGFSGALNAILPNTYAILSSEFCVQ
jgi:hypothetical protein